MRTSNDKFKQKKLKEIKDILHKDGYKVLSNYIDRKSPLKVQCPNGHDPYTTTWEVLSRGSRCRQCHIDSLKNKNPRFKGRTREQFRNEMTNKVIEETFSEGYISDENFKYVNNRTHFKLICPRGHEWKTTWNNWDNGRRCSECKREDMFLKFEDVDIELKKGNCILLEWHGTEKKMLYICECGNKHKASLSDWRNGHRCPLCGAQKAKETIRKNKLLKMKRHFEEKELSELER